MCRKRISASWQGVQTSYKIVLHRTMLSSKKSGYNTKHLAKYCILHAHPVPADFGNPYSVKKFANISSKIL